MKKLLVILAFGVLCVAKSEAASAARGAKGSTAINYTLSLSTVSTRAAVVYAVIVSSSAAQDYVVLFDSATAVGLTAASTTALKTRCIAGSTTANTTCNYDPPLQFNNGIIAANSSATSLLSLIIWETGRVTQGY